MITQQLFATVIDNQQTGYSIKKTGIQRELLPHIPQASGFASIITGIRRCGKSTLQLQVKKYFFPDEGLVLNFEDPRLSGIKTNDLERLYNEII
ncbi:MAG: AAA family ATPase, partial [Bacteroidales bacterium]|nr:AAA family ATPase [Bacteroidales bacterium]